MLDELQTWYRNSLKGRIEKIEEAKKYFKFNDIEKLKSLRSIAHSLRGSGATYGFPIVSEKAAALEDAEEESVIASSLEELLETLKHIVATPDSSD